MLETTKRCRECGQLEVLFYPEDSLQKALARPMLTHGLCSDCFRSEVLRRERDRERQALALPNQNASR